MNSPYDTGRSGDRVVPHPADMEAAHQASVVHTVQDRLSGCSHGNAWRYDLGKPLTDKPPGRNNADYRESYPEARR
jgi:hypothetical protein